MTFAWIIEVLEGAMSDTRLEISVASCKIENNASAKKIFSL